LYRSRQLGPAADLSGRGRIPPPAVWLPRLSPALQLLPSPAHELSLRLRPAPRLCALLLRPPAAPLLLNHSVFKRSGYRFALRKRVKTRTTGKFQRPLASRERALFFP